MYGHSQLLDKITIENVLLLSFNCSNNCRFSAQPRCYHGQSVVSVLCRSGYYQLQQLRPVARSLSVDDARTLSLVHAFVSSRLDYCNALQYGVSEGLLRRVQSVQNAAARLVTGARAT